MVDLVLQSKHLMKLDLLTESKKYHMMEQCATWCGVIQMSHKVGLWVQEVQDIFLEETS